MNKTIIGLTGRKKSGKDTVCEIIGEFLNERGISWKRFAFADPLKRELANACGVTVEEINAQKDRYRGGLQWWGTEFRRGQDPEYWTKQTLNFIRYSTADVVIITDCRFDNEAEMLRGIGGVIISVRRIGIEQLDPHSSEAGVNRKFISEDIQNIGTLKDLKGETFYVLRKLKKRGLIPKLF